MLSTLSLVGCLLLSGHSEPSQNTEAPPSGWIKSAHPDQRTQKKIDQFLNVARDLKSKAGTPGAAIAIVVDGQLIYRGGMGFANVEKQAAVQPDTLFAAGSCTKAMTGIATAQLVHDGKIDWDDLAIWHLPSFRMADAYVTKNVRVRDMFTHTTGLARHDQLWLSGNFGRDQILERLPHLELGSGLRERYEYNNMMFTLGGVAAAKAADTSWDELMRDRVFKPLKMAKSLTTYDEFIAAPNRSTGYDPGGTKVLPHRTVDVVGPAGSVTSTIEDMSHWLLMLVNEGQFAGQQVVPSESLRYVTAPQATIVAIDRVFYGIGWEVVSEQGQRVFQHGGGIDGQNCYVKVLPDENFGIVILSNHQSDFDDQLAKYASAIFVHENFEPDRDAEQKIVERRDRYRSANGTSDDPATDEKPKAVKLRVVKKYRCLHEPSEYAGRYRHEAYGEITIVEGESGQFDFSMGELTGYLQHRGYEFFDVHTGPNQPRGAAEIGFRSDTNGEVTALTTKFDFGSPDLVFRRVTASKGVQPTAQMPAGEAQLTERKPNVMRSNKLDISYRIGSGWPGVWVIMPEVSPDTLDVPCKDGARTRVTFESDREKRTFVVSPGRSVEFDIVLPDGKVAKTKLVGRE